MADLLRPGQTIGKHRVVRLLGEGGMGAVYEVLHIDLERRDALKIMLPEFARRQDLKIRFIREAKVTNRVQHPGIVQIYEISELSDGTPYFIMEYLDGETLAKRIDDTASHPTGRMGISGMGPLRQVATIIARCHEKGLIHRDLKPNNIMLVKDPDVPGGERAKLLDFGIVKIQDQKAAPAKGAEGAQTQVGQLLGTPEYMAPEQWGTKRPITEKVDVYALGVMGYRILSGRLPFVADTPLALGALHVFDRPPSLKSLSPELPPDLCALIERMLAKDFSQRPSMSEVVAELDRILGGSVGAEGRSGQLIIPESFSSAEQAATALEAVASRPTTPVPGKGRTEALPPSIKHQAFPDSSSVKSPPPPPAEVAAGLSQPSADSFVPSGRPAHPDAATARGHEPAHHTISLDYDALLPPDADQQPASGPGNKGTVPKQESRSAVEKVHKQAEGRPARIGEGAPVEMPSAATPRLRPPNATLDILSQETAPLVRLAARPAPPRVPPWAWVVILGLAVSIAAGIGLVVSQERSPRIAAPDLLPQEQVRDLSVVIPPSDSGDASVSSGADIGTTPAEQREQLVDLAGPIQSAPEDAGATPMDLAKLNPPDLLAAKTISRIEPSRCVVRDFDLSCLLNRNLIDEQKQLLRTSFLKSGIRLCSGERMEISLKNGKPFVSRVPPSLSNENVALLQYTISGVFGLRRFPELVVVQCPAR